MTDRFGSSGDIACQIKSRRQLISLPETYPRISVVSILFLSVVPGLNLRDGVRG